MQLFARANKWSLSNNHRFYSRRCLPPSLKKLYAKSGIMDCSKHSAEIGLKRSCASKEHTLKLTGSSIQRYTLQLFPICSQRFRTQWETLGRIYVQEKFCKQTALLPVMLRSLLRKWYFCKHQLPPSCARARTKTLRRADITAIIVHMPLPMR